MQGRQRQRESFRIMILSGFLVLFLFLAFPFFPLCAESLLPDYKEAREVLLDLWEKKYVSELKPIKILENPEAKGILCARRGEKGKARLCYYHFKIHLVRLYRQKEKGSGREEKQIAKGLIAKVGRDIETWLQCHIEPVLEGRCQWKLYFLRRDLLPGKQKYWE